MQGAAPCAIAGRLQRERPKVMPRDPEAQVYVAKALDRAAHRRRDDAWLATARTDPASRIVLLRDLLVAASGPDEAPRLHAPTLGEYGAPLPEDCVFLGERDGVAWFAHDAGTGDALAELVSQGSAEQGRSWPSPRGRRTRPAAASQPPPPA